MLFGNIRSIADTDCSEDYAVKIYGENEGTQYHILSEPPGSFSEITRTCFLTLRLILK